MAIVLGDVEFRDFEIPNNVQYGVSQRLAVHRLNGGTRIVEVLGPDASDIRFSGTLSGPDAVQRAMTIEKMSVSGESVNLEWGNRHHRVLIKSLECNYVGPNWIPYDIVCTIAGEEAIGRISRPPADTLDTYLGEVSSLLVETRVSSEKISEFRSLKEMVRQTPGNNDAMSRLAVASDALMSSIEDAILGQDFQRNALNGLPASAGSLSLQSKVAMTSAFTFLVQHYLNRICVALTSAEALP